MPELPEVECYRLLAERRALGRRIVGVDAHDGWFLKDGLQVDEVVSALLGRCLVRARRRGKLLLLDLAGGTKTREPTSGAPSCRKVVPAVIGLRFGMSGRLVVDGVASIDELLYSSNEPLARYDRFAVRFADGGDLRIRDPRRLGGVELDPDEQRLGPDAATIGAAALRDALAGSAAPLKARLLDQSRVAGVGNLIADEVLWRASLSPVRAAGGLNDAEIRRLRRHLVAGIDELIEGGGSHTGILGPQRWVGGRCPRDGADLTRSKAGGRTTWWCRRHQH
ncbi:MAG: formamidopyrimidine-DNA glycosylase [Actinomycetota bacterium]|nr:formamidopyrimidine-DNA glycosylase [Actinomycetota bacterium]